MPDIKTLQHQSAEPSWKRITGMVLIFWISFLLSLLIITRLPLEIFRIAEISLEDLDFSDISYQLRNDKVLKKDVVLINIGSAPAIRPTLIQLIPLLERHTPKTIGIDVYFPAKKDSASDNKLDSLLHQENIVFGVDYEHESYFPLNKSVPANPGFINFTHTEGKTERTYYSGHTVPYNKTDTFFESFACKMYHIGYGTAGSIQRKPEFQIKYYGSEKGFYNIAETASIADSNDFPAIEAADIVNGRFTDRLASLIHNKNVIIGWLGTPGMDDEEDMTDKHVVPTNSKLINRGITMPGAVVHANVLQMLIRNDRIREIQTGWFYTIAIILSFLLMTVFYRIEGIKNKFGRLLVDFLFANSIIAGLIATSVYALRCNFHFPIGEFLVGFGFMLWIKNHCITLTEYITSIKFKTKKMKKKIVVMILFIVTLQIAHSQVRITVYEGSVHFVSSQKKLTTNYSYTVPEDESIQFENGSISVVFTKSQFFYVTPGKDVHNFEYNDIKQNISYSEIKQKFQKMGKGAAGILDYLQKIHTASELEVSTSGSIPGGVKGITERSPRLSNNTEIIWPEDPVKLLSDTVTLQWPKASQLYGTELIVINMQSNDTVYNELASPEGKAMVTIAKEGTYKWFLYSKLENKKQISRVIAKPGDVEKNALLQSLNIFKSQLAVFDEETASLILEDYLYKNKLVEN